MGKKFLRLQSFLEVSEFFAQLFIVQKKNRKRFGSSGVNGKIFWHQLAACTLLGRNEMVCVQFFMASNT